MTEETRETCLKLLDRVLNQEYENMFSPPPAPWKPTPTPPDQPQVEIKAIRVQDRIGVNTPQTMTMRKFCHYLFKHHQDEMLAIVQSNREPRRKVMSATHPFIYRRRNDEAAVDALVNLAKSKNITITGDRRQQVDSYGEYRAEHLNYKSRPSGKKPAKMNIPGVVIDGVDNDKPNPQPIPPVVKQITKFVSTQDMDETIKMALDLVELEKARKEEQIRVKKIDDEVADDLERQKTAHDRLREIESKQRVLIRKLSGE